MNTVNFISFPGLGIGEMRIDKIAFSVFGLEIRWYGIIIAFAMIAGFTPAGKRKRSGSASIPCLTMEYTLLFSA